MSLAEIIRGRRSVRAYQDQPLSEETIKELINLGIYAPSGSNMQPWAFVVVQDQNLLQNWSHQIKQILLEQMETNTYLQQYKGVMENKDFNVFYNAPCFLLIYGNTKSPNHVFDCSMVAQNIMLAAHEQGIGSCWIGFSMALCNSPEIKAQLNVPENYRLVAPMVLGYPRGSWPTIERHEPNIFSWIK